MFQVKLIIFFLIVSVAGGGYVYVQKLRADNATLKINTTKLQGAVEQNEATIKQQTENFERVRDTLADVRDNRADLQADKDVIFKDLAWLTSIGSDKHTEMLVDSKQNAAAIQFAKKSVVKNF